MATYVITGHPLSTYDLGLTEADLAKLLPALDTNGVGEEITVNLTAPAEAEAIDAAILDTP